METVKTALVIQNCMTGDFNHNLESTLNFISLAAEQQADMIVFPEMNLTGYTTGKDALNICMPADTDELEVFSALSAKYDMTILTGIAEKTIDKKIFALHLVYHPDGRIDQYRKIHTAPFEKTYFSAGNQITIFESCGFKFGLQLCYDAHFPELSLAMALKGVDAILIPHASPRGSCREKFDSWTRHLTARAFDNGIYICACNQTGDNGSGLEFPGLCLLVGPDGNIVYHSIDDSCSEGIHFVELVRSELDHVRSHRMRYFLPNRRDDLFKI